MLRLDHLRYRRLVDAYVDGELDGELRLRVDDHVSVCPMCGREARMTVHVKHSLACRHGIPERAVDRMRRWVSGDPS